MAYGLLGHRISHSYSPLLHGYFGDYSYKLYDIPANDLENFLTHGNFEGLNVTSPYKKAVIPYCTELSDRARILGAVNTIVRASDGRLIGHNSDYFGFQSLLTRSGLDVRQKKILILGSGGASCTVQQVLLESGAQVVVVSRTGVNNYDNLHLHSDAAVIVNATPVGMFPNTNESPIDLKYFVKLEGVIDLIYNPARTKLLMDAEDRGLIACNGLWMLVAQAKESSQWFQDRAIDDEVIAKTHSDLRSRMMNTILIGMPGSGKTSVGGELAEITGKRFVDTDALIEQESGRSIADIFASDGEQSFRTLETRVLSEIGKRSGQIIATGGGCVLAAKNYRLLHQNGIIIRLERNLSDLPTDGRPLSQKYDLQNMYVQRDPLYRKFADYTVSNHTTIREAALKIAALEDRI